jgi:N-methylhydantoinase A
VERAVAEALAARLPGFPVTCSGEVWPEIREYERTVIACVNAQVQPLMERYLGRLRERLEAAGAGAATLQLTSSAGGVVSLRSGLARPVETLFSGPASGVMAAAKLAGRLGITSAVTFDMGGTSADVALLQDGAPAKTTQAAIGDLPIMLPVVGVSSIGAGGGSIVSADAVGVIKVGPESAGSRPGPVAYGQGGTRPTITDCYLATGILDPEGFLDGRMHLDRAAAEAALAPLAERLGLPGPAAVAEAALRVATVQMATYLFKLLARSGTDPARLGLMPYGGAGPTQANLLAEEAGLDAVVVPPYAATFCALGAILADIRRDFVRSLPRGGRATRDTPFAAWAALEAEAAAWIAGEGARIAGRHTEYAADMRYSGQSHDMVVRIPAEARHAGDPAMVAEAFHREHERLYGFREADEAVEVTTVRLSVLGQVPAVDIPERPPRPTEPPPDRWRQVYLSGAWRDVPVRVARHLAVGEAVRGPLLVEASDTTLLVLPGWQAMAGRYGEVAIRREATDHAT